jgi:DNA polymerase-3 subunit beta
MQMPLNVAGLRRALALLEPVIPKKSSVKACQYVLLGEGKVMANSLEMAVTVDLPDAQRDGEKCLLPHGAALDFLRYVPGSQPVGVVAKGAKVMLMTKTAQISLESLKADEFPPMPEFEPELTGVVDGDELVKAMMAVAAYTATAQDRPMLTAVCLTLAEPMEVAGADGFRLAVRTLRCGFPGGNGRRVLVPADSAGVLAQLWKMAPPPAEQGEGKSVAELVVSRRPMELQVGEKGLRVHFGEMTVWLQLIQGNYPNYVQLIPTGYKSRLTFVAEDLTRAVKTVAGMAKDGSGIVRLRYETERLTLSSAAAEVGNVETSAPIQLEGEAGHIAFDRRNLLEYLKGREGVLVLELNSPSNPGTFVHRGEKVVVMPMAVQWGEPAKAAEQPQPDTAESPPSAEGEAPSDVEQDEGPPPPEVEAATQAKPKRSRKRKAKTTE